MSTRKPKVRVRQWTEEDIPAIRACQQLAYPDYTGPNAHYDERVFRLQFQAFPQGQCVATVDDRVVGYASSLIVALDEHSQELYTYDELTGSGTYSTHSPGGETLYGADIAVIPEFRGKGVAAKLYAYRNRLLTRYNLRRMLAHGRLPGYVDHAGALTPEEYVEQVRAGALSDSALNAHLKAGYEVTGVMLDIMRDSSSMNYSTLLELKNPKFRPERRQVAGSMLRRPVRKVRVCAAQWHMTRIREWDEFEKTVEFFVDTADVYHCHFLVFPEYFTAQLFSTMPSDTDSRTAMRKLADLGDRYREMFVRLAVKHQLHIIGGSHPVVRGDRLVNVGHLFTPSGQVLTQDKLHITPGERAEFGVSPGDNLRVFDTAYGRIGILVCYDIEFPELTILLRRAGVDIIFVPFSTDDVKAYHRVRYSAQARAIENVAFTVIAGNAGNLPTIRSYLINYAKSAVFSPSDVGFPRDAVIAEAEADTETVVIADLDLTSLQQQRQFGNVRPLYDARPDLYEVIAKVPVEVIRAD